MNGISVGFITLLIVGLPQSFLAILAFHFFSDTKVNTKKYIMLSLLCALITYLFRFLPIELGVNTVLTLLIMIVAFQFAYKTELSRVIRVIVSAVVAFILIAVSELADMLLLTALFGSYDKASELLNSEDGLIKSVSVSPSNLFFAAFIFIGYFILKKTRKRKNGEAGTKVGK